MAFLLQSVLSHGTVADCAVVGKEDPLKGHVPLALCVLKKGELSLSSLAIWDGMIAISFSLTSSLFFFSLDINATEEQVLEEIVKHVRQSIGPVAAFRNAVFVKQLPKTRSGKIPRSTLSALVNGKPYKVNNSDSIMLSPEMILIMCWHKQNSIIFTFSIMNSIPSKPSYSVSMRV